MVFAVVAMALLGCCHDVRGRCKSGCHVVPGGC